MQSIYIEGEQKEEKKQRIRGKKRKGSEERSESNTALKRKGKKADRKNPGSLPKLRTDKEYASTH